MVDWPARVTFAAMRTSDAWNRATARGFFGGAAWCAALLVACDSGGGGVAFEGRQDLLPGFSYDTGYLPEGLDVQLRAVASATGSTTVRARATGSGATLTPVPGSGSVTVGGELSLEVFAHIDTLGFTYDGTVDSFEYAVAEQSTAFDPFSIGTPVTVTAILPAQELGSVPVPSVPGATLTIAVEGGQIAVAFSGVCAMAADGVGQYTGTLVTTGTVDVSGTISIAVPFGPEQEFGPFPLTVPIPMITSSLDLGARSLADGTVVAGAMPCSATPSDAGVLDGSTPIDGAMVPDGGVPDDAASCDLCAEGCNCVDDAELACRLCDDPTGPSEGEACTPDVGCAGTVSCIADVCRALCREDAHCSGGRFCTSEAGEIAPCASGECDLSREDACPSGEVCLVVGFASDGRIATECTAAAATLSPGSACDGSVPCEPGYACSMGTCAEVCSDVDPSCEVGSCTLFAQLAEFGIEIGVCE